MQYHQQQQLYFNDDQHAEPRKINESLPPLQVIKLDQPAQMTFSQLIHKSQSAQVMQTQINNQTINNVPDTFDLKQMINPPSSNEVPTQNNRVDLEESKQCDVAHADNSLPAPSKESNLPDENDKRGVINAQKSNQSTEQDKRPQPIFEIHRFHQIQNQSNKIINTLLFEKSREEQNSNPKPAPKPKKEKVSEGSKQKNSTKEKIKAADEAIQKEKSSENQMEEDKNSNFNAPSYAPIKYNLQKIILKIKKQLNRFKQNEGNLNQWRVSQQDNLNAPQNLPILTGFDQYQLLLRQFFESNIPRSIFDHQIKALFSNHKIGTLSEPIQASHYEKGLRLHNLLMQALTRDAIDMSHNQCQFQAFSTLTLQQSSPNKGEQPQTAAQRLQKHDKPSPEALIEQHRLKTEIMDLTPSLYLNAEAIDATTLDHIESSAYARSQIEVDYKKWQDNLKKLAQHKKTTLEAPPSRPRTKAKALANQGRGDHQATEQQAQIKKKQEEDDERYARELQRKLNRENGSPSRHKKILEYDEDDKFRGKAGKGGLRIPLRKVDPPCATQITMSKYGRQRKLNRFLQLSDSDSTYEEKKRRPAKVTKKKIVIDLDDEEHMPKGNAHGAGNRSPSQESPRAGKKPNGRLGVKRGPYRVRPKSRVADAYPSGNRHYRRDEGEATKAAGRAGGVLGKRNNNKKQIAEPEKKRRQSSEQSSSRSRSSSSNDSSSSSSNGSSSGCSSSAIPTSELSHGSIDSRRRRRRRRRISSSGGSSSSSSSRSKPKQRGGVAKNQKKNTKTKAVKPQRQLLIKFDFEEDQMSEKKEPQQIEEKHGARAKVPRQPFKHVDMAGAMPNSLAQQAESPAFALGFKSMSSSSSDEATDPASSSSSELPLSASSSLSYKKEGRGVSKQNEEAAPVLPIIKTTTVPELKDDPEVKSARMVVEASFVDSPSRKQTKDVIREKIEELRQKILHHLQSQASQFEFSNPQLHLQQQSVHQNHLLVQTLLSQLVQRAQLIQHHNQQQQQPGLSLDPQASQLNQQLLQSPLLFNLLLNQNLRSADPDTARNIQSLIERTQMQQQQINLLQTQIQYQNALQQVQNQKEQEEEQDLAVGGEELQVAAVEKEADDCLAVQPEEAEGQQQQPLELERGQEAEEAAAWWQGEKEAQVPPEVVGGAAQAPSLLGNAIEPQPQLNQVVEMNQKARYDEHHAGAVPPGAALQPSSSQLESAPPNTQATCAPVTHSAIQQQIATPAATATYPQALEAAVEHGQPVEIELANNQPLPEVKELPVEEPKAEVVTIVPPEVVGPEEEKEDQLEAAKEENKEVMGREGQEMPMDYDPQIQHLQQVQDQHGQTFLLDTHQNILYRQLIDSQGVPTNQFEPIGFHQIESGSEPHAAVPSDYQPIALVQDGYESYLPIQDVMNVDSGEVYEAVDSQGRSFLIGKDNQQLHLIDPTNCQIDENGQISLIVQNNYPKFINYQVIDQPQQVYQASGGSPIEQQEIENRGEQEEQQQQQIVYLTESQAANLGVERYAIEDGQGGHTVQYLTSYQVQQLCMPQGDPQQVQYELTPVDQVEPDQQLHHQHQQQQHIIDHQQIEQQQQQQIQVVQPQLSPKLPPIQAHLQHHQPPLNNPEFQPFEHNINESAPPNQENQQQNFSKKV